MVGHLMMGRQLKGALCGLLCCNADKRMGWNDGTLDACGNKS